MMHLDGNFHIIDFYAINLLNKLDSMSICQISLTDKQYRPKNYLNFFNKKLIIVANL